MSFASLELSQPLLRALEKVAYQTPTPIQSLAIPLILAQEDVLAQARTGTGKTAAFALPALSLWAESTGRSARQVHTLVLTPTRELALQVSEAMGDYGQFLDPQPRIHALIGGEDSEIQIAALRQGADMLVATPGRLLDLLRQQQVQLQKLALLVLDEADKMLSLGFAAELAELLKIVPARRQTVLFSATFPDKVRELTRAVLTDPIPVRVAEDAPALEGIQQRVIEVDADFRGRLLRHLIKTEAWESTLVFVASKRGAANLAAKLQKDGIKAVAFHGNLTQQERVAALKRFETGRDAVLIATDIAARGLDIDDISHVVNFDLPRSPDDYLHRIGRTARAGKAGMAISLISAETAAHFRLIEKRAQLRLEREQIAGFEPHQAPIHARGKPPVKGKRKSRKDKLREAQQAIQTPDELSTRAVRIPSD